MLTEYQMKKYRVNPTQLNNLIKLHNGLIDKLISKSVKNFTMSRYTEYEEGPLNDVVLSTNKHPCKTSACAVGHGPSCGVPFNTDEYCTENGKVYEAYFVKYIRRAFGTAGGMPDPAYSFLFSSNWSLPGKRNITELKQAILRLAIFIHSGVPDEWRYQQMYRKNGTPPKIKLIKIPAESK